MEWETDQDRDAERFGYEAMARRVRDRATPDERVQRSPVGALTKRFNDMIFDFEHGIRAIDAHELEALGASIARAVGMAQEEMSKPAATRELAGV